MNNKGSNFLRYMKLRWPNPKCHNMIALLLLKFGIEIRPIRLTHYRRK